MKIYGLEKARYGGSDTDPLTPESVPDILCKVAQANKEKENRCLIPGASGRGES